VARLQLLALDHACYEPLIYRTVNYAAPFSLQLFAQLLKINIFGGLSSVLIATSIIDCYNVHSAIGINYTRDRALLVFFLSTL